MGTPRNWKIISPRSPWWSISSYCAYSNPSVVDSDLEAASSMPVPSLAETRPQPRNPCSRLNLAMSSSKKKDDIWNHLWSFSERVMSGVKLMDLKPSQPLVEDRTCFLNSQPVEIELKRKGKFSQARLILHFPFKTYFFPFKERTIMACLVERRELGFHQNTEPKKQQQFYFINDSYWSCGNNFDWIFSKAVISRQLARNYIKLKGQCHEFFCFRFFSWIIFL